MSQLQKIACHSRHRVVHSHTMKTVFEAKQLLGANCRLSLNTGRLVMHSLYLNHLVEVADGSRHALAINSRICAAFCVLPVYTQLLALE